MSIDNALASIAVKDLKAATAWYEKLLGRAADSVPMPEVAEWRLPRGGVLQVYQLPERAGSGSFTLAVTGIEAEAKRLLALGIGNGKPSSNPKVKTLMFTDPDGNHVAIAEALDPSISR